jgi:hypothetical protein
VCALAYDLSPRRATALGSVLMGATRTANAATAVLPLVLAGTTSPLALAGPFLLGLYSAGITAHSASEGLPVPRARNLLFARVAAFAAFAGAGARSLRGADGPAIAAFVAAFLAIVGSQLFVRALRAP